jgi:maestro heat-like repeat-containing protein family member 1
MEVYIIQNITPTLKNEKYPEIRENGLKALDLVGKSVHPSRMPDYTLKSRDELIDLILSLIGQKSKDTNIHALRKYGLEAMATLIKLPPRLDSKVQTKIMNETLFLYSVKVDPKESPDVSEEVILENLNLMLISLLNIELKEGNLNDLLLALEPYTKHKDIKQREKSMNSYVSLLKEYAVGISEETQETNSLNSCGRAIAEILPRFSESSSVVRKNALDAIYLLLRIHFYLEKGGSDLPASIKKLGPLRAEIESNTETDVLQVAKKLSVILSESIIPEHLSTLVNTLFTTLGDVELNGANGTCLVLNGLIRYRGKEMETNVNSYIKTILKNLETHAAREPVVSGLLFSIRGLARHHTALVIKTLVGETSPHSKF